MRLISRGTSKRAAIVCIVAPIVLTLMTAGVVSAAPPSNDSLTTPRVIPFSSLSGVSGATNVEATKVNEPTPSCQPNVGATVWWRYRPGVAMSGVLSMPGAAFDTVLAVYKSTANGLVQVACDDNSGGSGTSILVFQAASSTAYYIQVGGYLGATAAFALVYQFDPANDTFSGAQAIKPGFEAEFSNVLTNANQASEPTGCGSIGHTVWYRFKSKVARKVSFDTYGSEYDSQVAVYRGSALSSLQFVACADDTEGPLQNASLSWTAKANVTYYIQVGGYQLAAGLTRVNFVRTL